MKFHFMDKDLEQEYEQAVQRLQKDVSTQNIARLRALSIKKGIPTKQLRSRCWKIFLQAPQIDVPAYYKLVELGPSKFADKIQKDTSRTFTSNVLFQEIVSEASLIRILNAVVQNSSISYMQGMNALLGPLLFVMSEPEAYFCFV